MKIKLKILTPVHISSGVELSPSEYFIDKVTNELKVVNLNSLIRDSDFKKFEQTFVDKAASSRYLGEIIPDHKLLNRHVLYSIPTSPDFRAANKVNLKAFIKSGGRVYIPGSSIKGAILSALLYRALLEEKERSKISSLLTSKDKSVAKRAYDDLLDRCYKNLSENPPPEKMRFLSLFSVSDTALKKPQECLKADICHVVGARSSRPIPIMYETLRPETVFEFDLKKNRCRFSEKQILEICDDFYKKVAHKENLQQSENPYLIRLGQGSSRYAVSFLIAAEELQISEYLRRVRPPRTRKRIKDGRDIEMGFARLEILKA
ncbi:MAG: type III-A CRISPR-associated RAMP protein Csm5 [Candidatus Saccharicenans sp.]|nr:type III-A CRISPR-associated RAMP protein Csm5 [Candidatus Saccharicenans sp.]